MLISTFPLVRLPSESVALNLFDSDHCLGFKTVELAWGRNDDDNADDDSYDDDSYL